jgi:hypothetical protein
LFLPAAPTSVTATAGNAQATVSWTAPTGVLAQTPVTDYTVQYSSNSGSSWTTFTRAASTATSGVVVTSLTNNTAYVFRVRAVNGIGSGAYSSASVAVTPTDQFVVTSITGLKGWFDPSASNSVYDAESGGSEVTSNGGAVRRLVDLSGNGRHLTTRGMGAPTLVTSAANGKSALSFAHMQSPFQTLRSASSYDSSFAVSNPLTIFLVWNPINDGACAIDNLRYPWNDIESSTRVRIGTQGLPTNGTSGVIVRGPANQYWAGMTNILNNGFHVIEVVMNGTSSTVRIDGNSETPFNINWWESVSPSTINLSASMANLTIGFDTGDQYTAGQRIGEMLFVEGALSDSTRTAARNYLKTKWGIA